ncbi:XRE family transcriptional regulator [Kitasatospora sp. NPDC001539]|uniref:XRE family transcriptional regulator n=1 Tax=Kitasatospora sp. NPDC001539 TaxID=3154384 RepID=UPI00331BE3AD
MAESTGDVVRVRPQDAHGASGQPGASGEAGASGGTSGSGEAGGSGEATGLSARIEALFNTVRRPDREQYTNEEVARACREATGESFSTTYLWQLRTGRRDNPTKRHLEALAQFFQVPPAYFFDERQGAEIAKELALLGALRDAGVRSLALRAVGLSPEGLDTVSELVDVIARRDASRRRPSV